MENNPDYLDTVHVKAEIFTKGSRSNFYSTGHPTDEIHIWGEICSKSQLSYDEVTHAIDGNEPDSHSSENMCSVHVETLTALSQLSQSLRENRKQNNLVIEGRPDYQFILNDQKKLERIEIRPKNSAHIIIEEFINNSEEWEF